MVHHKMTVFIIIHCLKRFSSVRGKKANMYLKYICLRAVQGWDWCESYKWTANSGTSASQFHCSETTVRWPPLLLWVTDRQQQK